MIALRAIAALRAYDSGEADLADYLMGIRNRAQNCDSTWTFDKRAARSPWYRLIPS